MSDPIYVDIEPNLDLAFARKFRLDAKERVEELHRITHEPGPVGDLQRDMLMLLELLIQLTADDE